jgi:hypothetical protein
MCPVGDDCTRLQRERLDHYQCFQEGNKEDSCHSGFHKSCNVFQRAVVGRM